MRPVLSIVIYKYELQVTQKAGQPKLILRPFRGDSRNPSAAAIRCRRFRRSVPRGNVRPQSLHFGEFFPVGQPDHSQPVANVFAKRLSLFALQQDIAGRAKNTIHFDMQPQLISAAAGLHYKGQCLIRGSFLIFHLQVIKLAGAFVRTARK